MAGAKKRLATAAAESLSSAFKGVQHLAVSAVKTVRELPQTVRELPHKRCGLEGGSTVRK